MTENYSFVGFDGSLVELPPLSAKALALFSEYNHFIVIRFYNTYYGDYFYNFLFFNNSFSCVRKSSGPFNFYPDGLSTTTSVVYSSSSSEYSVYRDKITNYNYTGDTQFFSCSNSLLPYCDTFTQYDFSHNFSLTFTVPEESEEVEEPEEVIGTYTLAPIVEKEENIAGRVFDETIGILPILMVVFVGFIGIRKGINYLFGLLRRS